MYASTSEPSASGSPPTDDAFQQDVHCVIVFISIELPLIFFLFCFRVFMSRVATADVQPHSVLSSASSPVTSAPVMCVPTTTCYVYFYQPILVELKFKCVSNCECLFVFPKHQLSFLSSCYCSALTLLSAHFETKCIMHLHFDSVWVSFAYNKC